MDFVVLDENNQNYYSDCSPPAPNCPQLITRTDSSGNSVVDIESLTPGNSPTFTSLLSVASYEAASIYNIAKCQYIWCSEYAHDIDVSLKEIEKNRRPISYKSPQMNHRATLLELMKVTAQNLNLGRTTVHLAVYLLDVFMDSYKINELKLNAVTLICILLAAKMEERDQNIPKLATLREIVNNAYDIAELKSIEIKILEFFNWYLLYPTAAIFLESYVTQAIDTEEFNNFVINNNLESNPKYGHINTWNEMSATMNGLIFEYLDLTLQDQCLVQATPSKLSAACLAAGRFKLGIWPIWTDRLVKGTGYTSAMIEDLFKTLIKLKNRADEIEKFKNTPDSGFLSESTDTEEEDISILYGMAAKRRCI